jgi:hypothetical protein
MEEDLNKNENGRQSQTKTKKMKDDLNKIPN